MASTKIGRGVVILMLILGLAAGYLISTIPPQVGPEKTLERRSEASRDSGVKRYEEAVAYIRQHAFFSVPKGDLQGMTAASLKSYLAEKDPYSDFLTPEEYDRFKAANSRLHAGIGLDVEKQRNGDVICYPVPEGPAAMAGIQPGERLLAIDGVSTRGKPLSSIAAMAIGPAGTDIQVELESFSGARRQVGIRRSAINAPTVSEYTFRSARIIKLSSFTPNTRQELDYLISSWHKNIPIIIDLRACGGGDFYAAVDSAMLFLEKGEPIISVRERSGVRSYRSTIPRQPPVQRVFLWQDEFTASAAEIFLAALTENARGTSVGRTSAGKGTRQDVIELQDGSALILTTGYLITPHGIKFDGQGLAPMRKIEEGANGTGAFFEEIAALLS